MARGVLHSSEVAQLKSAAAECAPDQSLRAQYNQATDPHRYEYMLRPFVDDATGKEKGGAAAGPVFPASVTALAAALCPELVPDESFCIVSEPGSADQPEHTDSVPNQAELSAAEWQRTRTYLGVLTPLTRTGAACGQTAVMPRSHLGLPPPLCHDPEERVSMRPGDLLLLDGRTVHRGLANTSSAGGTSTSTGAGTSSPQDAGGGGGSGGGGRGRGGKDGRTDVGGVDAAVRLMCFCTFKRAGITDGNSAAYAEQDGQHNEGTAATTTTTAAAHQPAAVGDDGDTRRRRRRRRDDDDDKDQGKPVNDRVIRTGELKRRRKLAAATARDAKKGDGDGGDDVIVIRRRKHINRK